MSTLPEARRPRLLPQNRKLRHLKGLSLRNLCFAPTSWQTADDASIVRSPNQLGKLHSSRSSESLRTDSLRLDKRRPKLQSRRSSLSLAHASPSTRQKKLRELVEDSLADVFFSLHIADCEKPVYISEVRHRSANFNFQFFDLAKASHLVSRSCTVVVRIWSQRPRQAQWAFLLEELVDLRRLNFIGTVTDRRFPPNALIFHLEDGSYSFDFPAKTADPKPAPPATTSSYNALMRLANLESSIQDALETQQEITEQINQLLRETPGDPNPAVAEQVRLANRYIATQQRANKAAEMRRDNLRQTLDRRKQYMIEGREAQALAEGDVANGREKLAAAIELSNKAEQQIRGQRRRICSELSEVFSISPIPNAPPLSFQICGLPLPNAVYDAATAKIINEDALSAALGLVAMLTKHLQLYLSHLLPYPISAFGSRSYVCDNISQMPEKQSQRREFPLYLPRGGSTVGQWRFEYGWFLLNKNIEALCAAEGLRIVDIRHSLPNLKYLLYVCSAGSEDMPERKKGGVRGLWAGKLKGRMPSVSPTPAMADGESVISSATVSLRGSEDGDAVSRQEEILRNAVAKENDGKAVGSWGPDNGVGAALPFGDDAKFTLRTKGLREDVAR